MPSVQTDNSKYFWPNMEKPDLPGTWMGSLHPLSDPFTWWKSSRLITSLMIRSVDETANRKPATCRNIAKFQFILWTLVCEIIRSKRIALKQQFEQMCEKFLQRANNFRMEFMQKQWQTSSLTKLSGASQTITTIQSLQIELMSRDWECQTICSANNLQAKLVYEMKCGMLWLWAYHWPFPSVPHLGLVFLTPKAYRANGTSKRQRDGRWPSGDDQPFCSTLDIRFGQEDAGKHHGTWELANLRKILVIKLERRLGNMLQGR